MLDFKKNRLDYGKLLNPPEGFRMERAVATTYSLDLTAFLSIPVALFYNKNMDGKISENRMDIFDAIQKTSETITIYCQRGKIKQPENINRLFSFLEDSVVEILPDEAFKSFHPKLWIVRYKNQQKEILYRVIVLSRNLTFDRSWDVAFCTEGFVSKSINKKATALSDLVTHLIQFGDFNNSVSFINDLRKTDFQISKPFNEYGFHPMGFDIYKNPLHNQKWQDLIIVSPFLHKDTLKTLKANTSGNRYLFSRKEELDKIHLDDLKAFTSYSFSQNIIDGEDFENVQEEADDEPLKQNLHAKIYIGTNEQGQTKWYLGSANCSQPAMSANHEFLIGLNSADNLVSVANMLDVLLSKDKEYMVFEEYNRTAKEPVKSDEYDFRKDIFQLLYYITSPGNVTANCTLNQTEKTKYDIAINVKSNTIFQSDKLEFSFAPYGFKGDLQIINSDVGFLFEGIAIHNLSPFITWRIKNLTNDQTKEFITRIAITLPDDRRQEIFKSIIQDKDRFIQLIQFMLGANDSIDLFSNTKKKKSKAENADGTIWLTDINIYEEMLLAASRNPNKLKEIGKLVERLKTIGAEELIPTEFHDVWEIFKLFQPHE